MSDTKTTSRGAASPVTDTSSAMVAKPIETTAQVLEELITALERAGASQEVIEFARREAERLHRLELNRSVLDS